MLLPHESTVSHETQQEKGVLTARQLTAAQELTNGGSKVGEDLVLDRVKFCNTYKFQKKHNPPY